jgi:hypothetical protein
MLGHLNFQAELRKTKADDDTNHSHVDYLLPAVFNPEWSRNV